ncbi:hypothetical protein BH10PSE12_BH10PSE12_26500 [soil metagenome]
MMSSRHFRDMMTVLAALYIGAMILAASILPSGIMAPVIA